MAAVSGGRLEVGGAKMVAENVERKDTVPAIVALYEDIGRTRSLTALEVIRLERAIRRARSESGNRQAKPWTIENDRKLRRLLMTGKRPAQIQFLLRRTERAIWRRMYVLGWTVRMAEQGSIALPRRNVGG